MTNIPRRWAFPAAVVFATCFGVYVLPFLLPPPPLAGVSSANVAGFNNKVAAVLAAALSLLVFAVHLRRGRRRGGDVAERIGDYRRLPLGLRLGTIAICSTIISVFSYLVVISHLRHVDAGYFMEQINTHVMFGRKLYDEIEFPYGPLIFYGPIAMRTLLAPWHISAAGAYFTTVVVEHVIGLVLVGYVIDSLPMLRRWRMLLFLLCAVQAFQIGSGLNYTFLRFMVPLAFLVLGTRQRRWSAVAGCFFAGEVVCLAISPEMGFAFGAASTSYAAYFCFREGGAWLVAAAAPFAATAVFLLGTGGGYLRMLKLFAKGVYNLIVEPLPHTVVFLFALVWLVPLLLARAFRERWPEAPRLAAFYIFALALLPVAFGRADAAHVMFNGMAVYMLSFVAISAYRPRSQAVWATCAAWALLWTAGLDILVFQYQFREVIHYDVIHFASDGFKQRVVGLTQHISQTAAQKYLSTTYEVDTPFDMAQLQAIVGHDPVAVPYEVPLQVEEAMEATGQYRPGFYSFQVAVLDTLAEDHELSELNQSRWLLLPDGIEHNRVLETPANTRLYLGVDLPYKSRRVPYIVGRRFEENLQSHWERAGKVGVYAVYRRR